MSNYSLRIISAVVATIAADIVAVVLAVKQGLIVISFIADYCHWCSQRNTLTASTCTKARNKAVMDQLKEYHKRSVSKTIGWKATAAMS